MASAPTAPGRILGADSELAQELVAAIAELSRALSHPARLQILQMLTCKQTCLCGEIVEELPLAQSTVSQHLKVLREAGLIKGEVEGTRSCYCLDGENIQRLRASMDQLFDRLERASGCCC